MKRAILILSLSLIIISQAFGQTQAAKTQEYSNEIYKFSVYVPGNWKIYGQIRDDQANHKAIVDWGLPLIYSDLEKTDIENSISITAYKRTDIQSVDQLILFEKSRVASAKMEADNSTNAFIVHYIKDGLEYKGKAYFVYKNEIGYIINFMATPGTYDKNLVVFEQFYKNIKFQ